MALFVHVILTKCMKLSHVIVLCFKEHLSLLHAFSNKINESNIELQSNKISINESNIELQFNKIVDIWPLKKTYKKREHILNIRKTNIKWQATLVLYSLCLIKKLLLSFKKIKNKNNVILIQATKTKKPGHFESCLALCSLPSRWLLAYFAYFPARKTCPHEAQWSNHQHQSTQQS